MFAYLFRNKIPIMNSITFQRNKLTSDGLSDCACTPCQCVVGIFVAGTVTSCKFELYFARVLQLLSGRDARYGIRGHHLFWVSVAIRGTWGCWDSRHKCFWCLNELNTGVDGHQWVVLEEKGQPVVPCATTNDHVVAFLDWTAGDQSAPWL